MADYSKHKINGLHSLDSLICDILINDGPDGHIDGHDIIAEEIWKRIQRALKVTEKVDSMIQYLKDEIKRTKVKEYEQLCRQELAIYENILKSYTKLSNEIQSPNEVKQ